MIDWAACRTFVPLSPHLGYGVHDGVLGFPPEPLLTPKQQAACPQTWFCAGVWSPIWRLTAPGFETAWWNELVYTILRIYLPSHGGSHQPDIMPGSPLSAVKRGQMHHRFVEIKPKNLKPALAFPGAQAQLQGLSFIFVASYQHHLGSGPRFPGTSASR